MIEGQFVFQGSKAEKDLPKEAGFRFDWDNLWWYTSDPLKAAKLHRYAEKKTREALQQYIAEVEAEAQKPSPRLELRGERWVWVGGIESKDLPKNAGFSWNKLVKGHWATSDDIKALRLLPYLYGPGKERLETTYNSVQQTLAASRAVSADLDLPRPEGLDYLPFQKAGIAFGMERGGTLFGDDMGLGKQQPVDTKVLTPTGWVKIGCLRAGDYVIGSNGQPTKVTGVFPQGVKPSYRVYFSDSSSVEAGPEHLWTVRHRVGGRRWEELTLTTEQIRGRAIIERKRGNRIATLDLSKAKLYLPMLSAPVAFAGEQPSIHPYLLGQLIANGSLTRSEASLSSNAQDWPEVVGFITQEGISPTRVKQYGNVVRSGWSGLCPTIRALGLNVSSAHKRIPPTALLSNPAYRIALLQGLMDADGSVSQTHNKLTYHSISQGLAEDVRELVEGLGGIASVRVYDRAEEGKPAEYQVRIRLPEWVMPFRVNRKSSRYQPGKLARPTRTFSRIEYIRDVESVCIAVEAPDRLYLTEHCILTHNTIQAIGIINSDPSIRRVLVVMPVNVKLNWRNEMKKWLIRQPEFLIAEGTKPTSEFSSEFFDKFVLKFDRSEAQGLSILLVNFDIIHAYHDALRSVAWDAIVVDEAHYLKNPKSRRTVQVFGGKIDGKKVSPINARLRLLLTGTAIVNRPIELFPLIQYLDPRRWTNMFAFAKRYCNAKQTSFGWDFSGASNLEELQQILRSTVMIRRTKDQVLTELPGKFRQVIEVPAGAAARVVQGEVAAFEAHEETLAQLQTCLELAKASQDPEEYKAALANLRQGISAMFSEMAKARQQTAVAKIPVVIEHLKSLLENDGKVIVFAHHREVIERLYQEFADTAVMIYGGISAEQRLEAVNRFQNDPSIRLFIGGITAAAEGITLTAAGTVVFAELDWRPGKMSQAEDRAHRIGQQSNVLVQLLVLEGSLDARMAQALVAKMEVIERLLDRPDVPKEEVEVEVVPHQRDYATRDLRPQVVREEAIYLTSDQIAAIHQGLRILAGLDEDFATRRNDLGFSKVDGYIGHSLANQARLTPRQAVLGQKLVRKYHRQLPAELLETANG